MEALIDLFVMETFPCALFSRVKDQSQRLMKSSICHIMSREVIEGFLVTVDNVHHATGTHSDCEECVQSHCGMNTRLEGRK